VNARTRGTEPYRSAALMRPATTIAIAVLLLAIVGAMATQLLLAR
jgi:hypothetical protein